MNILLSAPEIHENVRGTFSVSFSYHSDSSKTDCQIDYLYSIEQAESSLKSALTRKGLEASHYVFFKHEWPDPFNPREEVRPLP